VAEHLRGDWLLLQLLNRAYQLIGEAGLNFELVVARSSYPSGTAIRAEHEQFMSWARRFELDDVSSTAKVPGRQRVVAEAAPHQY
jgi:hypothetical protein